MGNTLEEDQRMSEDEKQWPRTLFKYLFAIIIIFGLLVILGFYEDPLDVSFVVVVLVIIIVIALMAGALLTGYEHVKPIADKFEDENVWQYIKMALIRLLVGWGLIYLNMSDGGGFLGSDSPENIVHNLGKFSLWIFAIYFVMAGLKSLYWVTREVVKNLRSDGDED